MRRPEVFYKIGVLRNFAKFAEKQLCRSLFFIKVAGATLLKKRLCHMCFAMNFVKFLKTPFLSEHLWWLFLVINSILGFIQFFGIIIYSVIIIYYLF